MLSKALQNVIEQEELVALFSLLLALSSLLTALPSLLLATPTCLNCEAKHVALQEMSEKYCEATCAVSLCTMEPAMNGLCPAPL